MLDAPLTFSAMSIFVSGVVIGVIRRRFCTGIFREKHHLQKIYAYGAPNANILQNFMRKEKTAVF